MFMVWRDFKISFYGSSGVFSIYLQIKLYYYFKRRKDMLPNNCKNTNIKFLTSLQNLTKLSEIVLLVVLQPISFLNFI